MTFYEGGFGRAAAHHHLTLGSPEALTRSVSTSGHSSSSAARDIAAPWSDSLLLRDFLEADPRPSFVIDLKSVDGPLLDRICFTNVPLRSTRFYEIVTSSANGISRESPGLSDMVAWATDSSTGAFVSHDFAGIRWCKTLLRTRWLVVAGSEAMTMRPRVHSRQAASLTSLEEEDLPMRDVAAAASTIRFIPGISDCLPDSPFLRFFVNFDWSTTALGIPESWNSTLKGSLRLLLSDPRPAALCWGPEHIFLYNENYIPTVGLRHPSRYGQSFKTVFPEVAGFDDFFSLVDTTRKAIHSDNAEFTLTRNGFHEIACYSYNLIPILDREGKCAGVLNPVFDTTQEVAAEKRMGLLTELGMSTAASRSVDDFWHRTVEVLQTHTDYLPFMSFYAPITDGSASVSSSDSGSKAEENSTASRLRLVSALNIPSGHAAAEEIVRLDSNRNFSTYFQQATQTNKIVVLDVAAGTLSRELCQGLELLDGEICRTIVIVPVKPLSNDGVAGCVLCGISPRRPFDHNGAVFLQVLSRMLGSTLAATVLVEEEIRRSRLLAERAAKDQRVLEQELAYQRKQARFSNMRFTEFAEKAPISVFMFDLEGRIIYANQIWRDIMGHAESDDVPFGWQSVLDTSQVKEIDTLWHKLTVEHEPISYEARLLSNIHGEDPPWIMAHAYPELNADGGLENIVGCFTDISHAKKAELMQQKRSEEAIAAKKFMEAFVDITSHELRNPMSVVLMCCEALISVLGIDANTPLDTKSLASDALPSALEAARTIMHCVTHQRRIVDDILTLSKLDSDLLPVSPVRSNVLETVQASTNMFTAEMKTAGIAFDLQIMSSFTDLQVHDVYVDPSRLAQVFINLLTNAIKFTQSEKTKTISVRVAASLTQPTESSTGVRYVESKVRKTGDITTSAEWGSGEPIYLQFSVIDSGRGLTEPERDLLFNRFVQASPRTHVQYGGSGLGLYICRELTERQGGQIGVSSTAGKGSTFAFYVKARRAPPLGGNVEIPGISSIGSATTLNHPAGEANTIANGAGKLTRSLDQYGDDNNANYPVLVVEDNLVNRRVLKKQLTRLGFPVYEAGHGREALDFLQETKFWKGQEKTGKEVAIMLLDCEMPVMNGLDCIREVRRLEQEGTIVDHLNTIAVTANARKEQIDDALAAGMDDVVSKPFTTSDLVKQIKKWVRRPSSQ